MKIYLLLLLFALTVTACTEERTVIHDNSASAKFTALFNNDSRWQVSDGDDKPAQADKDGRPVVLQDAPNNFAGYHIVTSFQTDPGPNGAPGQPNNGGMTGPTTPPGIPGADPWTVPSTPPTTRP